MECFFWVSNGIMHSKWIWRRKCRLYWECETGIERATVGRTFRRSDFAQECCKSGFWWSWVCNTQEEKTCKRCCASYDNIDKKIRDRNYKWLTALPAAEKIGWIENRYPDFEWVEGCIVQQWMILTSVHPSSLISEDMILTLMSPVSNACNYTSVLRERRLLSRMRIVWRWHRKERSPR